MGGNNEYFENIERNKYLKKKNQHAKSSVIGLNILSVYTVYLTKVIYCSCCKYEYNYFNNSNKIIHDVL